jgi:hypothetical protein
MTICKTELHNIQMQNIIVIKAISCLCYSSVCNFIFYYYRNIMHWLARIFLWWCSVHMVASFIIWNRITIREHVDHTLEFTDLRCMTSSCILRYMVLNYSRGYVAKFKCGWCGTIAVIIPLRIPLRLLCCSCNCISYHNLKQCT